MIITLLKDESMKSAIIGALGSIIGGIIGVIGALIVLGIQRRKDALDNVKEKNDKNNKMIKLLIIEIEHNIDMLKIIKHIKVDNDKYLSSEFVIGSVSSKDENLKIHLKILEDNIWNKFSYDLLECIDEKEYTDISYIYRDINLIKQQSLEDYKHKNLNYQQRIDTLEKLKKNLEVTINSKDETLFLKMKKYVFLL